ncbi:MAG TPA: hypothetical protein VE617_08455 [Propionibacteriaceae bacterium]|nr:hypothetical protein [Propionibacteriaceae bacterium]
MIPVRAVAFLALGLGLGALAGVVWWAVVDLPAYVVRDDGGAGINERGLSEFLAGDAWFCVIGLGVGAGLGLVAWRKLRDLGWTLVPLVAVVSVLAALVCWLVGHQLGPTDFVQRLSAARPGDEVPIELTLRAPASLLAWPFLAIIPVLLGSSLGPDEEEPKPLFRRRERSGSAVRDPEQG